MPKLCAVCEHVLPFGDPTLVMVVNALAER